MGSMGLYGMLDAVGEGWTSATQALHWHLRSNHYPPHPTFMVEVAKEALVTFVTCGEGELIELPEDVEHRVYGQHVPCEVLIESLHLWPFVEQFEVLVHEAQHTLDEAQEEVGGQLPASV